MDIDINLLGTYSGLKLDNNSQQKLLSVAKFLNIPNIIQPEKMHCTLIYSKKYSSKYKPLGEVIHTANLNHFSIFKNKYGGNALVIEIESDSIHKRNKTLIIA